MNKNNQLSNEGVFIKGVESLINEYYIDLLLARIKQGIVNKKKQKRKKEDLQCKEM